MFGCSFDRKGGRFNLICIFQYFLIFSSHFHLFLFYPYCTFFLPSLASFIWFPVPGSLNKKGGRRFHLLISKRLHLLPPFLSNEPGTVFSFLFFSFSTKLSYFFFSFPPLPLFMAHVTFLCLNIIANTSSKLLHFIVFFKF
jgi:hypothetical protein